MGETWVYNTKYRSGDVAGIVKDGYIHRGCFCGGSNIAGLYRIYHKEDTFVYKGGFMSGSGIIGLVEDGCVYRNCYKSGEGWIGYCKDGYIYKGKAVVSSNIVGFYEGDTDDAGAAAIALGMLG